MSENPLLEKKRFRVAEWNVFFMTRFRETTYHEETSKAVEDAVGTFGLEFVRADNPNWSEDILWNRVRYCLEGCHLGVAVFEQIDESDFNPNVALELGYMMALKRQCLLLKEQRVKKLPIDLGGHRYKTFNQMNIRSTALGQTAEWLKEIGVRKGDGEKVVVFVSHGGTCRCALAKAVARELFSKEKDEFRFESRAANGPSLATATDAAREAVQQKFGTDWLGNHRPMRAGIGFLYEADLILAMDNAVLSTVRKLYVGYPGTEEDRTVVREEIERKSQLVTNFFGSGDIGDIEDPWRYRKSHDALAKYSKVLDDLYGMISNNMGRLTSFLSTEATNRLVNRSVAFGDIRLVP